MSLLFNMLSRLVIAILPKSRHLLILWLQSPSTVILETKKMKSVTVSIVSPSVCHEVMGPDAMILVFLILSFKPAFSFFHLYQEALWFLFTFCHWSVSSTYPRMLIFLLAVLIPACDSSSPALRMTYSAQAHVGVLWAFSFVSCVVFCLFWVLFIRFPTLVFVFDIRSSSSNAWCLLAVFHSYEWTDWKLLCVHKLYMWASPLGNRVGRWPICGALAESLE